MFQFEKMQNLSKNDRKREKMGEKLHKKRKIAKYDKKRSKSAKK